MASKEIGGLCEMLAQSDLDGLEVEIKGEAHKEGSREVSHCLVGLLVDRVKDPSSKSIEGVIEGTTQVEKARGSVAAGSASTSEASDFDHRERAKGGAARSVIVSVELVLKDSQEEVDATTMEGVEVNDVELPMDLNECDREKTEEVVVEEMKACSRIVPARKWRRAARKGQIPKALVGVSSPIKRILDACNVAKIKKREGSPLPNGKKKSVKGKNKMSPIKKGEGGQNGS
ncbi:hypothetical protein LWI29_005238 [Acer saccharum]|uniref:Uncharacterized protein n=1 Tax=Acer saccharum TaxID=4024 RepID=A0AA39SK24_ACESA|nr:hypothetical protein LWI29_005238 [Acer saccharum]